MIQLFIHKLKKDADFKYSAKVKKNIYIYIVLQMLNVVPYDTFDKTYHLEINKYILHKTIRSNEQDIEK